MSSPLPHDTAPGETTVSARAPHWPLSRALPADDELTTAIPLNDPDAALQFCRQLARLVAAPIPASYDRRLSAETSGVHVPERTASPALSIVIPVFNEQANLPVLYKRLLDVLAACEPDFEIIFVDDGSSDQSRAQLQAFAAEDLRIRVVELARNFGHQVAISAGLDFSRGRGVIVMDADLQDPPEVLPQFIARWREGHDVVYAIRQERKESWLMRAAYTGFYRLLQRIANIKIPIDSGDFCLMDRRVVDLLVAMPERNRFVRGIRSWVGLDQVGLPYERHARYAGKAKYSFSGLLYLALDGLFSFSFIPLRIISLLGFGVSFLSIVMAIFYTIQKLTVGLNPPGFATLVVAILFLSGVQLITIGVIGEYIGRIFEEVKRRPLYVVGRIIQR